jgi:hypothetical protein
MPDDRRLHTRLWTTDSLTSVSKAEEAGSYGALRLTMDHAVTNRAKSSSEQSAQKPSRNFIISARFVSRAGAALGSDGMEAAVNGLIYIIGLIVVIMVVLSLLGLR